MKGCKLDTDGDGDCPVHPDGCPIDRDRGHDRGHPRTQQEAFDGDVPPIATPSTVDEELMYGGHIDRPGADRVDLRIGRPGESMEAIERRASKLADMIQYHPDEGEIAGVMAADIVRTVDAEFAEVAISKEGSKTVIREPKAIKDWQLTSVSIVDKDRAPPGCGIGMGCAVQGAQRDLKPENELLSPEERKDLLWLLNMWTTFMFKGSDEHSVDPRQLHADKLEAARSVIRKVLGAQGPFVEVSANKNPPEETFKSMGARVDFQPDNSYCLCGGIPKRAENGACPGCGRKL